MIRLVIVGVLLYIVIQVTTHVTEALRVEIDRASFGIGIGVAAIVGFLYFLITDWWSTVTRPARPQTVKHSTDETPSQITWASFWAIVRGAIFFTVVGLIIYLFLSTH